MSRHTARAVLEQFNLRPALVAERYAGQAGVTGSEVISGGLLADVREIAAANMTAEVARADQHRKDIVAAYGVNDYVQRDDKPFIFVNGYAIIPIHGILINRFAYSWSFVTGYNFIRNQVEAAAADEDVLGIIYDVNSQGGMVAGCRETSDVMYAASLKGGGKPSIAIVDANCYSAAYMLASAADKIAVTPTGGAGSIGVVLMHMDISAALDKYGVKVTFIFAGDHKVDGNSYQPLSDEVKADLKAEINKLYDGFVATVVRNRSNLTDEAVRGTQARCYLADDALSLGLIDAVVTPPAALEAFFSDDEEDDGEPSEHHNPDDEIDPEDDDGGDDDDDDKRRRNKASKENNTVSNPLRPAKPIATGTPSPAAAAAANPADAGAAANEAAATARTAERDRIQGILNHSEAEGRTELAQHFAYETDMSVEAAAVALGKSPKAAATVPVKVEGKKEDNHFKNAMDNGNNPNAGNDGGTADGGNGNEPSRAGSILGSFRNLAGKAPEKKTA